MTAPRRRTLVTARARTHADRAGDPLDGLVNLFDLAVVLAVAFLLVALTALKPGTTAAPVGSVSIPTSAPRVGQPSAPAQGRGTKVGTVYRLPDGSLVEVPSSP